jgi:hypothetical protein
MIPTKENLITSGKNETELTAGQQPTTSSAAVNWIGECGALVLFCLWRFIFKPFDSLYRSSIIHTHGHCGLYSRPSLSDIGELQFLHLSGPELVLQRSRKSDPGSVQKNDFFL